MSLRLAASACLIPVLAVIVGCSPAGSSASPAASPSAAAPSAAASSAPSSAPSESAAAASPSTAGGTGAAEDACDLLTADEVGTVVGEAVTAGQPTGDLATDGVSLCVFTSQTGALAITAGKGDKGAQATGFAAAAGAGATPVSGVGDEAYYLASGSTMYARRGDTYVIAAIQFQSVTGAAVQPAVQELVMTALGRL